MFLGGKKLLKLRTESVILDSLALKFVRPRRAVARSPRHESRGLRHAAPLGDGTLATRMGPAHQNSDRTAPSNDLLGFSRRGGQYAALSNARQEQLRIVAAAAVALQRFAYLQVEDHRCRSLVIPPPTTQPCH